MSATRLTYQQFYDDFVKSAHQAISRNVGVTAGPNMTALIEAMAHAHATQMVQVYEAIEQVRVVATTKDEDFT